MIRIDPEFQSLIPEPDTDEVKQLRENILKDGCREPLVVWKGHGILIDGHNRHAICTAEKVQFKTTTVELADRNAVKAWIIRNQKGRRNLSTSQKAMLASELERVYAEQAKDRQREQAKRNRPTSEKVANLPPLEKSKARDDAARDMGVSPRTVQAAKKVTQKATPELQKAVKDGEVAVSAAARMADLPPEKQREALKSPKPAKPAQSKNALFDHGDGESVGTRIISRWRKHMNDVMALPNSLRSEHGGAGKWASKLKRNDLNQVITDVELILIEYTKILDGLKEAPNDT